MLANLRLCNPPRANAAGEVCEANVIRVRRNVDGLQHRDVSTRCDGREAIAGAMARCYGWASFIRVKSIPALWQGAHPAPFVEEEMNAVPSSRVSAQTQPPGPALAALRDLNM